MTCPIQHPVERGKQRTSLSSARCLAVAEGAVGGFGGETKNSSGAGGLEGQRFAE